MVNISTTGARSAPLASPQTLQRRRIAARVGVGFALADVLADLVYGDGRREDLDALMALTAERIGVGCGR